MYEFLCCAVPFGEDADDPYQIYNEILNSKLTFPGWFNDLIGKNLIEQLLSRAPETRLGGSFGALKAHRFFDTFDWDALLEKRLTPPFVPSDATLINSTDVRSKLEEHIPIIQHLLVRTKRSSLYTNANLCYSSHSSAERGHKYAEVL